jgi:maltodextrin utilization protein YvdJ
LSIKGLISEQEEVTEPVRDDKSKNSSEEEILNQLILNIKALMFLDISQESIQQLVDKNLNNSHDEQVKQFLKFTQVGKKRRGSIRDYLLVAVAELIIASFLIIAGLAAVLPSVLGLTSPQELVSFIGQITSKVSIQALSDPAVPALELLLAVLLLLGAFHTVQLAALNLGKIEHVSR